VKLAYIKAKPAYEKAASVALQAGLSTDYTDYHRLFKGKSFSKGTLSSH